MYGFFIGLKNNEFFSFSDPRCRSCRLDKCLIAGLDWLLINLPTSPERDDYYFYLQKRKNGFINEKSEGDQISEHHESITNMDIFEVIIRDNKLRLY